MKRGEDFLDPRPLYGLPSQSDTRKRAGGTRLLSGMANFKMSVYVDIHSPFLFLSLSIEEFPIIARDLLQIEEKPPTGARRNNQGGMLECSPLRDKFIFDLFCITFFS